MSNLSACERAAGLLGEAGNEEDRRWLQEHLAACGDCAAMADLWARMGALPEATPDGRGRERLQQMLDAYEEGLQARAPRRARRAGFAWHLQPGLAMAAVVLLVAGLAGGWYLRGARAPALTTEQQLASLRSEVQSTRQIAVLSLLHQSSPSDRLQGVSYSTGLVSTDPRVMDALLQTLKYDSSPAVRLAALDTLTRHAGLPQIQQGLVDAFGYQKSPLVQVALVDSFVETGNPKARTLLHQISQNKAFSAEVRKRAAWGLAQPEWN